MRLISTGKIYRAIYNIILPFGILILLSSCGQNKKEDKIATEKVATPADILTEKIKSEPNNPELYFQRSKWNLSMKKTALAELDIRKAMSLDSTKSDYYLLLADICFAGFRIPDAETAFRKAASLDPSNIEAFLKLAELNLYMKKYEEAISNANEALRIDKRRGKAYFIKGFVYKFPISRHVWSRSPHIMMPSFSLETCLPHTTTLSPCSITTVR
ncbi:MAG: hypothetical protein NTV09_14130 [Bacteroidetes bacterium]|nr:hypothetical protein [Bacteroidota bacterium]